MTTLFIYLAIMFPMIVESLIIIGAVRELFKTYVKK